jgi:hypothetical protein
MPQTIEQLADDLKWAAAQFSSTRYKDSYKIYREYYDGIQNLAFATPKFNATFGKLFTEFAYNRSQSVVDAISDRLKLTGFTATAEGGAKDEATETDLQRIWRVNKMDRRQGEVHTEELKCGDAYVIVWPEPDLDNGGETPRIYANNADVIAMRYDDSTKQKIVAIKAWKDSIGRWRINFYYPDFIHKYVTPEKKDDFPKELGQLALWTPDPIAVELGLAVSEPNPLPNPYMEIPVFHFPNNGREGEYGRSELQPVIPLQDALNKACTDLMVAMEYGAFPQRWAVGLGIGQPDTATGKVKNPFKEGPGQVWTAPQGAGFGNFDITPLDGFIKVQESFDKKIANVARIPGHWFDMFGTPPSGESLKTAEAPFTTKLEDKQTDNGQEWENVFLFCLKTMGKTGVNITPNWKSAELRSENDKLDAGLKKKQLGWSEDQIQREIGLDDDTIELMKTEKADALAEQQKQFAAGQSMLGIPAGGGNTPPTPPAAKSIQQKASNVSRGSAAGG